MVKRKHKNIADEIAKLNEKETSVVINYISDLISTRIPKSNELKLNDDLIVSLSDAYENKRARQVFEWERTRRQNLQRAV